MHGQFHHLAGSLYFAFQLRCRYRVFHYYLDRRLLCKYQSMECNESPFLFVPFFRAHPTRSAALDTISFHRNRLVVPVTNIPRLYICELCFVLFEDSDVHPAPNESKKVQDIIGTSV